MPTSYFKKLTGWLKHNFFDLLFVAIIVGVGIFVAFKNYVPGTWLIGWDNLMPELNLKLNIGRSLTAAWQEYQGLGLLGGMAHAADLPRQIFLWISSLFIPTSFLRYFWTFLMLAAGPIGVYMVVSRVFIDKASGFLGKIAGLASAVFYLFNLSSLQVFYTPFETFVSFYGFIPWLLYFALDFLKNGGRKRLVVYFLISLFAASAFYVQTLFIVYAILLMVFALEAVIRHGRPAILRSVKLAIVTLFVNAFWLLSALYFTGTSAAVPANSHINSIATPETQLMNLARADFEDIATLKGYWFDYYDLGQGQKYDYLYKTWIEYTGRPDVAKVSLALFFVSALGITFSLLKKKTSHVLSLLVLFGIAYFMLDGGQVPLPFFGEIFRNAYTKWANVLSLIYAIGLGLFVFVAADVTRRKFKYFLGTLISAAVIGASVFSALPIINGNLIAGSMRLGVPSYYLDTINYFKSQDATKRIADFPLTDFWGWKFNNWGFRGSGFFWYGIPQPMLDRAFDVWSPYNETFYTEISHAVETGNSDELKYILSKYQIGFILFDGSVFIPGNSDSNSSLQKEKDLLETSGYISRVKEFGEITIYKVNSDGTMSGISAPKNTYTAPFTVSGLKGKAVITETFSDKQGYPEAKNCDLKGLGGVTKTKIAGGNDYTAYDGGTSCDYFYYPGLDYSKAYVMRIKGQNVAGRSLKFYLYNVAAKNMGLEELLPAGDFDKSYLILPTESSASAGLGYTLNVETRSFGKVKSENIVTAIEFFPVEVSYVNKPIPVANNLVVKNVQKYGTWAYKVETAGTGIIELGQGYDKGWLAFKGLNKPLGQTKVDGWANGWNVPAGGGGTVYIFFWPQLTEWFGGVLALAALIAVSLRKN